MEEFFRFGCKRQTRQNNVIRYKRNIRDEKFSKLKIVGSEGGKEGEDEKEKEYMKYKKKNKKNKKNFDINSIHFTW